MSTVATANPLMPAARVAAAEPRRASLSWGTAPLLFFVATGTAAHGKAIETQPPANEAVAPHQSQTALVSWYEQKAQIIRELGPNWDGYGADPIASDTIDNMIQLLRTLLPAGSLQGSLVPAADGSLQAEWHLASVALGLLLEEDKTVSTWVRATGSDFEIEKYGSEALQLFQSVASVALA